MARILLVAALTGGAALGGCAHYAAENPALTAYPGIQSQIENYYDANAIEDDWSCDDPQMNVIDKSQVVSQTASRITVAVNYYFESGDLSPQQGGSQCQGFSTRHFTFAKAPDGSLSLIGMTGTRRGGGV